MVTRAIGAIQRKGGVAKPELQLQSLEAQHLAGKSRSKSSGAKEHGGNADSSDGGSSSDEDDNEANGGTGSGGDGDAPMRDRGKGSASGSESDSEPDSSGSGSDETSSDGGSGSSSDPELDPSHSRLMAEAANNAAAAAAAASKKHMNNSLLNMYAKSSSAATPAAAAPPPAFAPPDVVAAAAARALAKERAEKQAAAAGKSGAAGGAGGSGKGQQQQQQPDPDGPSTSGRTAGPNPTAPVALPNRAPISLTAAGVVGPSTTPATTTTPGPGAAAKRPREEGTDGAADAAAPPAALPKSAAKRARRLTGIGGGATGAGGGGGLSRGGGGGSSSAVTAAKPVTYADLGGVEEVLADIRELIEYPLKHPEVYAWLGVEPPRGVLLHGPPGCGKTALANAIANECGVPFLRVSAPEIVSGMSGESEAKLRQLFAEARDTAPCIVFIDEIDAIFPKRETAQREMERRIVAQMLTCMDDLATAVPSAGEGASAAAAGGGEGAEEAAAPPPPPPHVIVIGATNRPDALDTALRRAGRFDREIALGIPTEAARVKILQVISRRLRLEGNFDFRAVAKRTPGFVGADLAALTKEAAAVAVTRIFAQMTRQKEEEAAAAAAAAVAQAATGDAAAGADATTQAAVAAGAALTAAGAAAAGDAAPAGGAAAEGAAAASAAEPVAAVVTAPAATATAAAPAGMRSIHERFGGGPLGPTELAGLAITMSDFEAALPKVQPSVRREGFTTTPDVTWDDVGALAEVREELSFAVSEPIRNPERFEALGLPAATGVLLYGPPGCGKTLVAKAVANESGANFISIKGPELLNKYVGESERAVRQLFARARAAHPCVLFFDEMDALAPRRGTDNNQAAERVVNQLLTEMDGVDSRQGIFMVAATNRPDMIDPALLRPGRLDKVLYVPLPPPQDRVSILNALVRRTPMEADVDLRAVGLDGRCEGFSGADMAALVREAAVLALKESMAAGPGAPAPRVAARHFEKALGRVQPSVSRRDRRAYEALRLRLRSTRSHIQPDTDTAAAAVAATATPAAPGAGAMSADDDDRTTPAAAAVAAAVSDEGDVVLRMDADDDGGDALLEDATGGAGALGAAGG
ncbi:hypothetical protein Agub_g14925, partial [Astrephomene gubernaculifera]